MKIVIYDSETMKVLYCRESVMNPIIDGNDIKFDDGELRGITKSFIVVDDTVDVLEDVTESILSASQNEQYTKVDESEQLKSRLEATEMAIITLMDVM